MTDLLIDGEFSCSHGGWVGGRGGDGGGGGWVWGGGGGWGGEHGWEWCRGAMQALCTRDGSPSGRILPILCRTLDAS